MLDAGNFSHNDLVIKYITTSAWAWLFKEYNNIK